MVGWSYSTRTICTCLFIWEPKKASVRLVHPRTSFKPPMANCFATDRSKVVTPRVVIFVVFGVLFEIDILINPRSVFLSTFWLHGEVVFSVWRFQICLFHFRINFLQTWADDQSGCEDGSKENIFSCGHFYQNYCHLLISVVKFYGMNSFFILRISFKLARWLDMICRWS
jgi:hypothetical protein